MEFQKQFILLASASSVILLFIHELDACHKGEWRMFKFMRKLNEKTQYLIFLYAHIPLSIFLFYYLWTVMSFNNIILWVIVNIFLILHFAIHVIARKWESNVFHSFNSFVFILGAAITGLLNLCLVSSY
jgi:hypothetical protein